MHGHVLGAVAGYLVDTQIGPLDLGSKVRLLALQPATFLRGLVLFAVKSRLNVRNLSPHVAQPSLGRTCSLRQDAAQRKARTPAQQSSLAPS